MRLAALIGVAAPVGLVAAHAAPALSQTGLGRQIFPVVARVEGARSVAITFDDGPDIGTPRFLDRLAEADAAATWFLMGEQVTRWPELPAAIREVGHEVAVHGFTHRGHLRRLPGDVADDLRRSRELIESAASCRTTLYRPPYGLFSLGSWRAVDREGWTKVLWNRWGKDWEDASITSARQIADTVGQPRAGDVILLHDSDRYSAPNSWRRTYDALPIILERIAAAGLHARTVSDLLAEAAARPGATE